MQTQYYAGWDGGGTKTLCRVLYQDGTAPQPFTAGALNPNGTVAGQCEATVADLLRNMAALPGGLDACRMLCIGAAGISAFPMSARVIQKMALKEDNQNHLLMHAVGANVAGQIGSVVAGGIILSLARTFGLL